MGGRYRVVVGVGCGREIRFVRRKPRFEVWIHGFGLEGWDARMKLLGLGCVTNQQSRCVGSGDRTDVATSTPYKDDWSWVSRIVSRHERLRSLTD